MSEALHNLPDDYEMYRLNYSFMMQSPMYTALEQKYRDLKKKCREQKRMIEFLNKQHMDLVERYLTREPVVEIKQEPVKNLIVAEFHTDSVIDLTQQDDDAVLEPEEIAIVVEEDETDDVDVEEEEEEEEEQKTEVEVVAEEEDTEEVEVEEAEEEVVEVEVVEAEEEVVEEEEETEEVVEEVEVVEEEEEGVYEVVIKGTRYYTTNETDGTIYAITDDDDIGDEVGQFVNGVAKL